MNVIHSIDGYMVREVGRRVNYDQDEVTRTLRYVRTALANRDTSNIVDLDTTQAMSVVYASRLGAAKQINNMSANDLLRLESILLDMQLRPSAELVCIHDAFKSLANACNSVRYWYKEVLAELAESDLLSQIFSEISGEEVEYENVVGGYSKTEMAALIRSSNYSIC